MLFNSFTKLSLLTTVFTSLAKADGLPSISVIGNKFFYPSGSQFYIRGVAYQANPISTVNSTFIDPLADKTTCARDIPYLEAANTNVIRVYALDVEADHSDCMQLLQDAGIYVIADLSEPRTSISTTDPEWSLELYQRYTAVIDMMQDYSNVLGFFAGNEVVTNNTNTDSAPFVKAAIRDMKRYMSDEGYRAIPIGYSANDDADTRTKSAEYFNCGDNDEVKADLYGINMYEWCGSSNFKTSGYEDRTAEFSNLTIPVFFSEYGCNSVQPRKFTEIGTIFGNDMTDVWSGGIVYMYFEEENNYGLVSAIDSTSVSTLTDYNYYSSEMNDISPTSATSADITVSTGNYACPATDSDWKAATALPPTPQSGVCDCMSKSLSCVVSDNVSSDDYSDLFATVCGLVDCSGITGDGETGEYGAYSFCSSKDMLSFAIDLYYQEQDQASSACDFDGSASLQDGSTASSCSSILSAAGTAGTGAITGTVSDSGSGSSSTASKASSTRSASRSSSSSSSSATSSSSSSSSSSGGAKTSGDFNVIFAVGAVVIACVSAIAI